MDENLISWQDVKNSIKNVEKHDFIVSLNKSRNYSEPSRIYVNIDYSIKNVNIVG